jgi:non-heme chloroperoxidase
MDDVRERRVRLRDGVDLRVRSLGDGPAAVLFIHGWMVSGAVWDGVLPFLETRGRTLIVPDLRGSGGSGRPDAGYTLAQYAEDLIAVLDSMGVEQALLVGHSMGGQLALLLAATAPARVRSVLALCPVPPGGLTLPPEAAGLFRSSAGDRARQGTILDSACLALSPEERERVLADAGTVGAACITQALDAWTQGGFEDRLGDIRAPVRVLATDDPFLPLDLLRAQVASKIKSATLAKLDGAGHYPQCERREDCVAVIESFCSKHL